jgi:phospholipase/carboxylesterase
MSTKITTIERPPQQAAADELPPLLLLLHGYGSNEHDLMGLAPYMDARCHIVSARAIYDIGMGYAWYHLYGVPGNLRADDASRAHSLEVLTRFLTTLPERLNVNDRRVYLLGFSQGAVMSLALALTAPQLVTGVLAISGYLDQDILARVQPEELSHLDVLLMHGTYDDLLPVELGRHTNAYLETLPIRLTYREYPIAHSIHPNGLLLAQQWLKERLDQPPDTLDKPSD